MRHFSTEKTPFGEMMKQKRLLLAQQHQQQRKEVLVEKSVSQTTEGCAKMEEKGGRECVEAIRNRSGFSLPSIPLHLYPHCAPSSPQPQTDSAQGYSSCRGSFSESCGSSSSHRHSFPPSHSTSNRKRPDFNSFTPISSFFVGCTGSVRQGEEKKEGKGKRGDSVNSKNGNIPSEASALLLSSSLTSSPRLEENNHSSMGQVELTTPKSMQNNGEKKVGRRWTSEQENRQSNENRFNGNPSLRFERSEGSLLKNPSDLVKEKNRNKRNEEHVARGDNSHGQSTSLLSQLMEMEKKEKEKDEASSSKTKNTRPVSYTITRDTSPKELISIIQTLQGELDDRTLSVNAIQRNFERLAAMYQGNMRELEELREEQGKYAEQVHSEKALQKVLCAMRVELEKQMEESSATKTKLEEERAQAEARERQLKNEIHQLNEQLVESNEKQKRQEWKWTQYEQERESWLEKQRERLTVAMESVAAKEEVKRQEAVERLRCSAEHRRIKDQMRHREALEQVLHEAIVVWKELALRAPPGSSSDHCSTRNTALAPDSKDLFAEAVKEVCGSSAYPSLWLSSSSLLSSPSSPSSSFSFSFPLASSQPMKSNEDGKGGMGMNKTEKRKEGITLVSELVFFESDTEETKDSLEYWVQPLRHLLQKLQEHLLNPEQQRRIGPTLQEHPSDQVGHVPSSWCLEKKENEQRSKDNDAALRKSQWMHWATSLLTQTEEESRRMLEVSCFHFYIDVCHHYLGTFRELCLTVSNLQQQKDQKIVVLAQELEQLKKVSQENVGELQELSTFEVFRLKEKISLLENKAHIHMEKIFLLEQERSQLKEALHIITLDAENERKRGMRQAEAYAQQLEEERVRLVDEHTSALQSLREEHEKEQAKQRRCHIHEIAVVRQRSMDDAAESQRCIQDGVTAMTNLVDRVETEKRALFEELLHTTVVEEELTRESIRKDEAVSLSVHEKYFQYTWEKQMSFVCSKQCVEVTQQETAARTALRIEEIASCTSMVFYISNAVSKTDHERKWKREREDILFQLDALRQRLHNKEKEHFILQEKFAHMEKNMLQHQNDLKEKDILQAKYDILEEEMQDLKTRQLEKSQNIHKIQKVALSSIQCLIAAEEASESTYSCPLCLELFHHPLTCTPCGHTFCAACIQGHARNVRGRAMSDHLASPLSKKEGGVGEGRLEESGLGFYCPECRAHCVRSLLRSKPLEALSSKFEYRRNILRDILALLHQSPGNTALSTGK